MTKDPKTGKRRRFGPRLVDDPGSSPSPALPTLARDDPFLIDSITLICNGCQSERDFPLPENIRSAAELIEWMKTHPTPCTCGSKTCNVKARIVKPS